MVVSEVATHSTEKLPAVRLRRDISRGFAFCYPSIFLHFLSFLLQCSSLLPLNLSSFPPFSGYSVVLCVEQRRGTYTVCPERRPMAQPSTDLTG